MSKPGRPRGGKHHPKIREYWRKEKGYKQKKDDLDELIRELLEG